ncbi:hypothetical protein CLV59_1011010 [Chitinophaga dinghuensis]|uniref:Uncharacterized protein n=1 Tax=Chitinophaga dinghuensis TaxID=1539050 RepID=A0A327WEB6_9BACT|nr:hypothetical protein [Chitinophaga dinghuensis]RAJ88242.1 hypothetical protein CLV59_1011010 [Chitinophaga dinghuensis]
MYRKFVKWYIKRQQRKAAALTDPHNPLSKNWILQHPSLTEVQKQFMLNHPPMIENDLLGITYPLWEVPDNSPYA